MWEATGKERYASNALRGWRGAGNDINNIELRLLSGGSIFLGHIGNLMVRTSSIEKQALVRK